MAWQTPKTDWNTNPTNPLPGDLNRIEGNIDFLNTDIETKKGLIADAIVAMNQAALIADTHAVLANKIKAISNDANAAVSDVYPGKTFYQGGTKKTGAMVNNGAIAGNITSQDGQYVVPAGYHNGAGKVTANIANLVVEKVANNANVGGVVGSYRGEPIAIIESSNGSTIFSSNTSVSSTSGVPTYHTVRTLKNYLYNGTVHFTLNLSTASGGAGTSALRGCRVLINSTVVFENSALNNGDSTGTFTATLAPGDVIYIQLREATSGLAWVSIKSMFVRGIISPMITAMAQIQNEGW